MIISEYENSMLDLDEKLIKSSKRGINISTIAIIACIILIPLYSYISFSDILDDKIWSGVFNFLISLLWSFNLFLNIKTRKKSKDNLKNFKKTYYERLKRIDNPRYLKETRNEKLKKLGY